jgi:methylmalonyl-CoA/ethylmalonyl-CoA epimerase
MSAIKRIHHIALLVEDIEQALLFWRDVLGIELGSIEEVSEQEAIVADLHITSTILELVSPISDSGGLTRFLRERGPGIHHICLEVEDLGVTLKHLKAHHIRLINPEPVIGSDGKRVAFIHPQSAQGVLVELCETQN